MSAFVFLGPTLSIEEASARHQAEYLPPAKQGDVLRALERGATSIGIIDGYFEMVPSVWHKEILFALSRGVHVFGAASMGALRAAELHAFGMVGVGQVFEWYRSGAIEDDDEVAVVHAPKDHGYAEQSDAMVNIRDTVNAGLEAKIIDDAEARALITIAKRLFYPERSYRRIFELAKQEGLSSSHLAALTELKQHRIPLKRRDAIALLEVMAERRTEPPVHPHVEQTIFLDRARSEVRQSLASEGLHLPAERHDSPEKGAHLDQIVRGGETLKVIRKKVLLRILAMREVERLGIEISDREIQTMADDFRRQYALTSAPKMREFLEREGIELETFAEMMREFAAIRIMERLYADEIDRNVPAHIRLTAGAREFLGTADGKPHDP